MTTQIQIPDIWLRSAGHRCTMCTLKKTMFLTYRASMSHNLKRGWVHLHWESGHIHHIVCFLFQGEQWWIKHSYFIQLSSCLTALIELLKKVAPVSITLVSKTKVPTYVIREWQLWQVHDVMLSHDYIDRPISFVPFKRRKAVCNGIVILWWQWGCAECMVLSALSGEDASLSLIAKG